MIGGGAFFALGRARGDHEAPPARWRRVARRRRSRAHPAPSASGASASAVVVSGNAVADPARCPADMIAIPGGPFFMGSDVSDPTFPARDEPSHKVVLKPFCIDRFEVKTSDYLALSDTSTHQAEQREEQLRRLRQAPAGRARRLRRPCAPRAIRRPSPATRSTASTTSKRPTSASPGASACPPRPSGSSPRADPISASTRGVTIRPGPPCSTPAAPSASPGARRTR